VQVKSSEGGYPNGPEGPSNEDQDLSGLNDWDVLQVQSTEIIFHQPCLSKKFPDGIDQ
jgi:hypothetical protein